ncbi:MAG TPA: glyceraldehyde 3-phosphate dehydrogenase NAD-binding domain-containing protein, partial [Cytophagaceae bacterium]
MTKVAINGLGRIGRSALKILLQYPELQLVAVNDIAPADNLAYLLNFDTVYGKAENRVWSDPDNLYINGKRIPLFSKKNPSELPWRDMDIDIVLECTGKFTTREELQKHIDAGAKRVILSAPAKSNDIITIVHGVNRPEGES